MIKITPHILKTICRKEDGVAIVEYALVLPVFFAMTVGMFEMGHIYMVNAALEGAVTDSSRTAMTGALPNGYDTRASYIESLVRSSLASVGVTTGITISMKVYDSFANIGKAEPYVDQDGNEQYDVGECFTDVNNNAFWDMDMGSTGLGGEENIMIMKVDVNLPYMTSFMKTVMNGVDHIELSASTAIRNEPFGGVSWEPSNNVICT
ncbi:MAG: pilus assembly protein [Emcibacter sp.]|nr:pilus assembly protein [Emcibacter sp.]